MCLCSDENVFENDEDDAPQLIDRPLVGESKPEEPQRTKSALARPRRFSETKPHLEMQKCVQLNENAENESSLSAVSETSNSSSSSSSGSSGSSSSGDSSEDSGSGPSSSSESALARTAIVLV